MSSIHGPAPFSSLRVSKRFIPACGMTPNTSIQNKPLLIYHAVFGLSADSDDIESHMIKVGIVSPQWRYTMFSTTHFHNTTHEVLCVSQGRAKFCFGSGDKECSEHVLEKGDVVITPAGVAHRLVEDLTGDFELIGCYPVGCTWDMCYGEKDEEEKIKEIASLK